jgi:hypothetical protein
VPSYVRLIDRSLLKLKYLTEAYEELLVLLLLSRSALTDSDYRSLIKALPRPRKMETGTENYTEEKKRKLERIIDRLINDPSSATWDDVFELENIRESIWDDIYKIKDSPSKYAGIIQHYPNLLHQAKWVSMIVVITKAYLTSRGKNTF